MSFIDSADINLCAIINGIFHQHEWEYKDQIDKYVPTHGGLDKGEPQEFHSEIRICTRCHRKQRKGKGFGINSKIWVDCDLTKDEIRDIKISKILI
jgi:hypothetical protein